MSRNVISTALLPLAFLSFLVPEVTHAGTPCSTVLANTRPSPSDHLPKDGIMLVRRQVDLLDSLFTTTGFANREEFKKAIDRLTGGHAVVRDLVLQEQVQVSLAAPSVYRNSILEQGLLNQHETGTSNVIYSLGSRNYSESSQLGIAPNTLYRAMDPKLKPKYAMLEPAPNSALIRKINTYGDDIYFLNLAKVRNRMTWTPGDSLYRAKGYEPRSWDQIFLPWEDRMLMIPLLLNNGIRPGSVLQFEYAAFHSHPVMFPIKTTEKPLDYIETQIWGPITLDDISAFEYKNLPPDGNFLRELRVRGIEIRDGRSK